MKAIVLALAALCAGAALAQAPAPSAGAAAPLTHMQRLTILLDLTAAQATQVQAILEEEHAQMKQAFQDVKAASPAGGRPNWQQMRTLHQQIRQETITRLTPVLNPTQLKKFEVLTEHGPRGHFRGRGPGEPGSTAPGAAPAVAN